MIDLKGKVNFRDFTTEDLLELGIQSISTISEASWKPKVMFKFLDGNEESFSVNKDENIEDKINNKINEIVRKKIVEQRKEKLNQLKCY